MEQWCNKDLQNDIRLLERANDQLTKDVELYKGQIKNFAYTLGEVGRERDLLKMFVEKLIESLTWALPFAHGTKVLAIEDLEDYNKAKSLIP